jgi:RsiW-degrading membrane proteinase PrsW (M82 family)
LITLVGSGLALWIGNMVAGNDQIAWLILPPLNIIATGLPALWVIYFGTRGLLPNPPRHKWGVFASGLVLGPLIILVIELFMLVGAGILAIISIMLNPTLAPQLQGLVYEMQNLGINPQALLDSILPFLLNPGVLFIGASFVVVLVPLVEELIKPIGVWFMAGQKITPAQGFGFGVLSGAGFGLFENLGNTSAGGQSWALLAGSRISTLFLHSFTAGLVGWALAYAWSERRFLRLAITFIIAVLIHGLWNGMAVLSAAASLDSVVAISLPTWFQQLGNLAAIGIFILGLVVVICFFGFNANLRKNYPTTLAPEGAATIPHPANPLATSESSLDGPSSEGLLPINPPPAGGDPSSSDTDTSLRELSENPQQSETNS